MAVVASVKSSGFKGKKKGKQQLGHSSPTCPSLEACRVEVVGTSFGESGWALLSSPTCCIGHSSIASNLLGNPCWAQGQDHVPYHPSRGRVHWKLSLESSWQRQLPWDSPLPSVNAHWQHNYKRAGVPPSQGRKQEKHMAKLISPERDFLKEHIGSTSAGGVDFRLCFKKDQYKKTKPQVWEAAKAYFSFKLRTSKTGVSSSPSLSSLHTFMLTQQLPRRPPFPPEKPPPFLDMKQPSFGFL